MTPKDDQVRATIAEQASAWFVANDEKPLDPEQSAGLVDWFKASPLHVEEFLGVAGIARDLQAVRSDPEHSVETLLARAQAEHDNSAEPFWARVSATVRDAGVRGWRFAAIATAVLVVVSLGLWRWNRIPVALVPIPHDVVTVLYETHHGEQQTHQLTDKSMLHLNTDTAVTIRYSDKERLVVLAYGEADVEVAHELERPFRMVAGAAEVIARGTEFDVRLGNDSTVVTVLAGRVAIEPSQPAGRPSTDTNHGQPSPPLELGPNQQITIARGEWPVVPVAVDAQRTTGWLQRQIAFDHEPLERVAAEFNRYIPKPIEVTTPELRSLEISGVFATDDPEAFIAFLRSIEGVRVDVTASRILVSKK